MMASGEILNQSLLTNAPLDLYEVLIKMTTGQSGLRTITFGETEYFIAYHYLPAVGYSLGVIVPSREMLAESTAAKQQIAEVTRSTISVSLLLVAAILSLSLLAALGIGNRLTLPLRALTRTAEEITGGNLAAEVQVRGRDEIGTLGRTLNTMTSTLMCHGRAWTRSRGGE